MHTIDTANAVGSQFANRDEINKKPGTIIDASIMNAMQNEIVNVILGAGIQLDKNKHDQLKTAIAKYITDLDTKLSRDITKLRSQDNTFGVIIGQIKESIAALGGGTTNYGSSTLIKTYTFSEPHENNYYFAPHTNGFCLVYMNGVLLRKTVDWQDANNGDGIALNFNWVNSSTQLNELEIICFVSGDMIKVTSQVPVGTAFDWYGTDDDIPQSYIKMTGQPVSQYSSYIKLTELYPVSLPNTQVEGSVKIVKAYDYMELGEDFSNRYYGPRSEDPLINMSGGIPIAGDCYYNINLKEIKYYNGTVWESQDAYYFRYSSLPTNTSLLTTGKKYLIDNEGNYFLPATELVLVGESIQFLRFGSKTINICVGDTGTETLLTETGATDTILGITSYNPVTLVYIGNKQWRIIV